MDAIHSRGVAPPAPAAVMLNSNITEQQPVSPRSQSLKAPPGFEMTQPAALSPRFHADAPATKRTSFDQWDVVDSTIQSFLASTTGLDNLDDDPFTCAARGASATDSGDGFGDGTASETPLPGERATQKARKRLLCRRRRTQRCSLVCSNECCVTLKYDDSFSHRIARTVPPSRASSPPRRRAPVIMSTTISRVVPPARTTPRRERVKRASRCASRAIDPSTAREDAPSTSRRAHPGPGAESAPRRRAFAARLALAALAAPCTSALTLVAPMNARAAREDAGDWSSPGLRSAGDAAAYEVKTPSGLVYEDVNHGEGRARGVG